MMIRVAPTVMALALLVACASPEIGERYRAERTLWKLDQRGNNLPRHPGPNSAEARALAELYAEIGHRHESAPIGGAETAALRALAARAWFSAVDLRLAMIDSSRAVEILEHMAATFEASPHLRAGVALRLGRLAESYGELDAAIEHYRTVVRSVPPDPERAGVQGSVLELPLHVTRLESTLRGEDAARVAYREARSYYREKLRDESPTVGIAAHIPLAALEGDLRRWQAAAAILDSLDRRLSEVLTQDRGFNAAPFRFGALLVRIEALGHDAMDPTLVRERMEFFLRSFPRNDAAPELLWAMAGSAEKRGRFEEAISLLNRLARDYPEAPITPRSVLKRARLLERHAEWPRAHLVYHLLWAEFKMTPEGQRAPLEIALRYRRADGAELAEESLADAEGEYRGLIARFPAGIATAEAHEQLAEVLRLQGRAREAMQELRTAIWARAGTPEEVELRLRALRLAEEELQDRALTLEILEETGRRFPGTRVGAWAARRAERLRASDSS